MQGLLQDIKYAAGLYTKKKKVLKERSSHGQTRGHFGCGSDNKTLLGKSYKKKVLEK